MRSALNICLRFVNKLIEFFYRYNGRARGAAGVAHPIIVGHDYDMIFGGFILGRYGHNLKKTSLVHIGFFAAGAALLMLGRTQNVLAVFVLIFFLGFGNAFIVAPLQTILHEKIPRVVRGRVFGVQNMLINSAFTFPVVILGELADLIGLRIIIISLGSLIIIFAIFDKFVFNHRTA